MHLPAEQDIRARAIELGLINQDDRLGTHERAQAVNSLLGEAPHPETKPDAQSRPQLLSRQVIPAFEGELVVEIWHVKGTTQ